MRSQEFGQFDVITANYFGGEAPHLEAVHTFENTAA